MTSILGISAFYHDSAAALVLDGQVVAAVQEERFTRKKYDASFPARSIDWCLSHAGLDASRLDYVAYYEQPLSKFERLIETYVAYAPRGFKSFRQAVPVWLKRKLHVAREIRTGLGPKFKGKILYPSHHESHAASAFYPSPFQEAAIITLDGVGEWSTTTVGFGQGSRVELFEETRFPHSLGLLYSAFTGYCGFAVNSGEYKLMGLAPYGKPRYEDLIFEHLIELRSDGSYWMNPEFFHYAYDLKMTGDRFDSLFGGPPRTPETRIEQRHMDLAASVQRVCEQVVLHTARHAWQRSGQPHALVMAGGVALNCVANGRLLREGPFEQVWIQPAAGDAGGALGAALFAWHQLLGHERVVEKPDKQNASWLGPAYGESEIRQLLESLIADFDDFESETDLLQDVAQALAEGQIVGWFQGRAEFGPRALGARSILGDPRRVDMQADLNLKIKFRESFRPFAPCVLKDRAHEWFETRPGEDSPYMLLVAQVAEQRRVPLSDADQHILESDPDLSRRVNIKRSTIPAVTHVDGSARLQTVDPRHGPFYRLLKAFEELTGCPILVNTSFNLSWEPIVLTPREAYNTFMQSEMDILVLERFVLRKSRQRLGFTSGLEELPAQRPADLPWAMPKTGEPLVMEAGQLKNVETGDRFAVEGRIPRFLPDADGSATGSTKTASFSDPFANSRDLQEAFRKVPLYRLLADQTPFSWRVLDYGCGQGWLGLFLAMAHRSVLAVDSDLEGLRGAERFRDEHGLTRATFAQMDLLSPALLPAFFDLVLFHGRIAASVQAREAHLTQAARLLKPGGVILVLSEGSSEPPQRGGLGAWKPLLERHGFELTLRFPPLWPDEFEAASANLFAPSNAETQGVSTVIGEILANCFSHKEPQALIARLGGQGAAKP